MAMPSVASPWGERVASSSASRSRIDSSNSLHSARPASVTPTSVARAFGVDEPNGQVVPLHSPRTLCHRGLADAGTRRQGREPGRTVLCQRRQHCWGREADAVRQITHQQRRPTDEGIGDAVPGVHTAALLHVDFISDTYMIGLADVVKTPLYLHFLN